MKRSPNTNPDAVEERLDPAIQAELDQLDAALRGEPIEDDALADLIRDVQATAPEMPSDLRKQLRHDVSTGFARRGVRGRLSAVMGRTGTGPRNFKLISGGSIAAVAAAGVFAVMMIQVNTGDDSGTFDSMSGAPSSNTATPESSTTDSSASGGAAAPTAQDNAYAREAPSASDFELRAKGGSTGGSQASEVQKIVPSSAMSKSADAGLAAIVGSTPPTGQRRVEQSVDMDVRVKSGEIDDASQKVESIVRQGDGYVADSQVSMGTRGAGSAAFTLKVASSKLDATMKRLADLGTVTSQQQASRDITSSFDTTQRRLEDNAELRKALLRSLAKADTDGEIASLKRRLADNRSSRAALERQLAQLRTRTNLTDIALTLNAPSGDAADEDDDGSWSIGDALSDAGKALGTVTGVLLVGGAVLLPFALLGAAGWAVYRVRRKRRRESALDA